MRGGPDPPEPPDHVNPSQIGSRQGGCNLINWCLIVHVIGPDGGVLQGVKMKGHCQYGYGYLTGLLDGIIIREFTTIDNGPFIRKVVC